MNGINLEKIINLTKSEGWKEFKKLIENEKYKLTLNLLNKYDTDLEKERIKIKAYESIVSLAESFGKSEKLKQRNKTKNKGLLGDIKGLE